MTRPSSLRRAGATALALTAVAASAPAADAQYPTKPPAAAAVQPAQLPPFQEEVLPNGLRVVLVENHRDPIVAFRLVLPAGRLYEPKGKEGISEMAAGLLTKGAGSRTADQVAEAIEGAGGSLSGAADDDFLALTGSVLADQTALAFQLLGDAVARPAFPDKEIDLLRTQTLSALQLEQSQPASIAARVFAAGLYGDHPYGRRPTPETVRAITKADLTAFQQTRLRPRGGLLVIAGDVTLEQVRALAAQHLAGWTGYPAANPAFGAPPTRARPEIVLVHRPGSVQSNIVVGNLTAGPGDPQVFAAMVANKVLGGGSDARLFDILREKKGWTYGAYSSLARPRGTGYFNATAEVRTEVTDSALVELLAQLRRLGNEPVPATELENAKGALVGIFPLTVETAQQVAERVAFVKTRGLPGDYLQTYRTRLSGVTAPTLQVAARRWVRPQQALVVVVGDGQKIHQKLAAIGSVRIVTPQGDAMSVADLTPRASAVALDVSRLAARRDSFVVRVQGNPMGASVYELAKDADGWVVREATTIAGGMIQQNTTLRTDASLAPRALEQRGKVQGRDTKADVTFAGGRAKGAAQTPSPQGIKDVAVDAELPAGTLDDNAAAFALPLLRWAPGAKHVVSTFSAGKGVAVPLTYEVKGTESVTVPAGTFEAFRIEQSGGDQPIAYFVTTAAPHRLVRIVVANQIEMALAK
ncbi:insulinase family protein [Roseisolibacter sp. H3M3-2]|uniref:insulinase family protein n=1 Tax=Roseisolibacter sp. H3M3-2 TaxID=3031323 RepID=UPI0023DB59A7|nr:insulinase family protein [Roseisolibacter sp. H3M3-2]MDF1501545.1 insulinase family protein [Roseisolibacter sp. H3M3-2]